MSPTRAVCDADPDSLTIAQAQERIQARLPRIAQTAEIACSEAKGRVCAIDVLSPMSVPSFRASAMDGYAVRSLECNNPLKVAGQSLAGHPAMQTLPAGCCFRITTGARVPDDADAVVQQENVSKDGDIVTVLQAPKEGLHVRLPGSDSARNSILVKAGSRLGASEIALLSAHGVEHVRVKRLLHVALFSTGDELRNPGQALAEGEIYDANRPLLQAMLSSEAVHVTDLGICPDSEAALQAFLSKAQTADIVISSGGVSVGDADYVRSVLEKTGQIDLWKIAIKPGRPLTFGLTHSMQAYFGLPGNPVSAAITALLFVIPAINLMLGQSSQTVPAMSLPLQGKLSKNPGRVEYQRAIMSRNEHGTWQASTTGLQDSHVLSSLHKANCLIELGVESCGANDGEQVTVYPFTHFSQPIL